MLTRCEQRKPGEVSPVFLTSSDEQQNWLQTSIVERLPVVWVWIGCSRRPTVTTWAATRRDISRLLTTLLEISHPQVTMEIQLLELNGPRSKPGGRCTVVKNPSHHDIRASN